jgi:hypothetical protein
MTFVQFADAGLLKLIVSCVFIGVAVTGKVNRPKTVVCCCADNLSI